MLKNMKNKPNKWEGNFEIQSQMQEWFIRQADYEEVKYFIKTLLDTQKREILDKFQVLFAKYNNNNAEAIKEFQSTVKAIEEI